MPWIMAAAAITLITLLGLIGVSEWIARRGRLKGLQWADNSPRKPFTIQR